MEYFMKSIDIAKSMKVCDSLILKNAYSNLEDLFFNVQDYHNSLLYAKKDYDISKKLHKNDLSNLRKIAMAYSYLSDTMRAKEVFDKVYEYTVNDKDVDIHGLYSLLLNLSNLRDLNKATVIFRQIKSVPQVSISAVD